jgi:endogenous inhibitor of DNA gyrase (YacG/DUF329 family)
MPESLCPICRSPLAGLQFRPFCSKRCADLDLHRWIAGAYAIPVRDDEAPTLRDDQDDE